jgi:hypothetical protein
MWKGSITAVASGSSSEVAVLKPVNREYRPVGIQPLTDGLESELIEAAGGQFAAV